MNILPVTPGQGKTAHSPTIFLQISVTPQETPSCYYGQRNTKSVHTTLLKRAVVKTKKIVLSASSRNRKLRLDQPPGVIIDLDIALVN